MGSEIIRRGGPRGFEPSVLEGLDYLLPLLDFEDSLRPLVLAVVTIKGHFELLPLDGNIFEGNTSRYHARVSATLCYDYNVVCHSLRILLCAKEFLALKPYGETVATSGTPSLELSQIKTCY
jgi:hypothetical protein